jgi:hypothetical protein
MTLEWIGLDPQTAKPVSLTETQECQDGADLAGARALVQLLGGK